MANLVDSVIKVPANLIDSFKHLLQANEKSCNFFSDNSWNSTEAFDQVNEERSYYTMFYNTHRNQVPQFIFDYAKTHGLEVLWRDLDGYGADCIIKYNLADDKHYQSKDHKVCNYERWIGNKSYSAM